MVPSRLIVLDAKSRQVPAGLLSPLMEGESLTLYCVATGGKYSTSIASPASQKSSLPLHNNPHNIPPSLFTSSLPLYLHPPSLPSPTAIFVFITIFL